MGTLIAVGLLVVGGVSVVIALIATILGLRAGRKVDPPTEAAEPLPVVEVPAPEPEHVEPEPAPPEEPDATAPEVPTAPVVHNRYYDEPTCQVFVEGLTDEQLARAIPLFEQLAIEGSVTARELAAELGVEPGQLPGLLITPIRRRADQLDLPLPFEVGHASGSKLRQWRDSGGVAARMARALLRSESARAATERARAESTTG